MSEQLKSSSPQFFGKDRFTPFIGQVEDVNDPKHSNRVKVRCIGWHPNKKTGEDSLSTDDLPWGKVGMPCTHAQQNRVGGKHGLLPGSWVWGFFLDGEEAQDPFIVNSFDFTAKASDEDLRTRADGQDGKASENDQAFDLTLYGENQPNSNTRTIAEKGEGYGSPGDPSGATVASDADDPCSGEASNESQASVLRREEELSKVGAGGEESQNYAVPMADGLCGSIAHAQDDIQRKMQERFPPAASRFIFGDAVWNKFSGNFIDMNGLMFQLAKEMCSLLKQPAQSKKAVQEELNRIKKAVGLKIPDRDGVDTQEADKKTTKVADKFHGIMATSFIDVLCGLIMQELQSINNETNEQVGTNPDTNITNPGTSCVAGRLVDNINTIAGQTIENAMKAAEEDDDDFEGYINSILSSLQPIMLFPLLQKNSKFTTIFNTAGSMSQDVLTKQMGCITERQYKTDLGALGALGGGSGSGSGGGDGSSGFGTFTDNLKNVGFGGLNGPGSGNVDYTLCEEATDPDYNSGSQIDGSENNNGGVPTNPDGSGGRVTPLPLPSDEPKCAQNFKNGIPNTVIVTDRGKNYFYDNKEDPKKAFPSVYIRNYNAKPIPVVHKATGELVAVLTDCDAWPNLPSPPVTIIPDSSETGIDSCDKSFDVSLGGLVVANTGFDYCNPKIQIIDRDTGEVNGEANLKIVDGRIVEGEIINTGGGFCRIPEIKITDDCRGFGAVIYPIMKVTPVADTPLGEVVQAMNVVYCPSKNLKNLY